MILAAFLVSGFVAASVYAVAMLRGRRDRYHRTRAAAATRLRVPSSRRCRSSSATGPPATSAADQPTKLAAMEGLSPDHLARGPHRSAASMWTVPCTERSAIPSGLSLLAARRPARDRRRASNAVPADLRPPVTIVHLAFDTMVGIGVRVCSRSGVVRLAWPGAERRTAAQPMVPARGRHIRASPRSWRWRLAGSPPKSAGTLDRVRTSETSAAVNPAPRHRLGRSDPHQRVRGADRGTGHRAARG